VPAKALNRDSIKTRQENTLPWKENHTKQTTHRKANAQQKILAW